MYSSEEVDALIRGLEKHQRSVMLGSIDVVGGVEQAKEILNYAPKGCNVYDVMYKAYGFMENFFMVDHNITVKLDDLREALSRGD